MNLRVERIALLIRQAGPGKVSFENRFDVKVPAGGRFLGVDVEAGVGYLLALVDPEAKLEQRTLLVSPPGAKLEVSEYEPVSFVGTVRNTVGRAVLLLFEVVPVERVPEPEVGRGRLN